MVLDDLLYKASRKADFYKYCSCDSHYDSFEEGKSALEENLEQELSKMTNGDVIMTLFPNGDLHDYDYYDGYVIYEINYEDFKFSKSWWDAPYNKE